MPLEAADEDAMVKDFARKHGPGLRSLAVIGGGVATVAAAAVGAVLAVFFAATVVVIALMASALLALAGLALRAKRSARVREDGVIEARRVGGHHWVAYGWNERLR
jgi:hypothetical protein